MIKQSGRLGWLSLPSLLFSKNCLYKVKLSGCSRNSFAKSLIDLNVFKALSALPSLSPWTLPGRKVNYRSEHSPHCVCIPPAIIEVCLAALGWGAGVQGGRRGVSNVCTCPTPSSPGTHAGHLPESASETFQHTLSSIPVPKKELNMLNIIA